MALQNITNVCEKYKGKIALMSFTQIRPSNASAIPRRSQEIKSYQKLTSRLELNSSTYEPISSLELVLSNLIIRQKETLWQQFIRQWDNTLLAEGRDSYDKRIPIYRERNWDFSEFHRYLTLNCFPLHPQSDNPDPLKVKEIKNKQKQLKEGIKNIDDWLKPIKKASSLSNNSEIDKLSSLYSSLIEKQQLSQLPKKKETTNVDPTQQQKDQYSQTLQNVRNKIEELVCEYPKRAKSLKTSEQHGAYKVEVQNAIEQLRKIDNLPNRFITILESSKEDAKTSVEKSQEHKKIDGCLSQIQNLSRRLGSNATQNDYIQIVSDIKKLVKSVPEVKSQETYQQIIQKIEQQQKTINSLLEQWQKQYVEIASSVQATQLKEQIIRQENRFTESDSKQQVKTLLTNLKTKFAELINQEQISEKRKAAQKWLNSLANKEEKLENLDNNQAKVKTANDILAQIQIQKNAHFEIFNEEEEQLIEQAEEQCQEIINKDQESKIIAIFQNLTDEQKISLYKKLSQYLPQ